MIARAAGIPLKIAAKVDRVDEVYFRTQIKPLLEGPGVEFIGEIDDEQKTQFLSDAQALLFPIDWPEPTYIFYFYHNKLFVDFPTT